MSDKKPMEPYDLEGVYDSKIAPLMTQIIEVCRKHQMPMLATFAYCHDGMDGTDYCTTSLLRGQWQPSEMQSACQMVREGLAAYTIRREVTRL